MRLSPNVAIAVVVPPLFRRLEERVFAFYVQLDVLEFEMIQSISAFQSLQNDQEVFEGIKELFASRRKIEELDRVQKSMSIERRSIVDFLDCSKKQEEAVQRGSYAEEAIVLSVGRPSMVIQNGQIDLSSVRVPSLRTQLSNHKATIEKTFPSTGRVELSFHPSFDWVGTAWMLEDRVMVTNRHVAEVFCDRSGGQFPMKNIQGRVVETKVDFLEEHRNYAELEIEVESVLYVAPNKGNQPDIAFLRIKSHPNLPDPLELDSASPRAGQPVGVVGYSAWDGRRNPGSLMPKIFQDIYEVKRFAPGCVVQSDSQVFTHDCSTTGGNSGSAVIAQETGKVVGLHFAGRFRQANFALPVEVIKRELARISTSVMVDDLPESTESLSHREGYEEEFLGTGEKHVPLPALSSALMENAAPVQGKERSRGIGKYVLDYTHFSIVMNKDRRLAYYTAVNIDGTQEVAVRRRGTRWKTDPRIKSNHQIDNYLYRHNRLDRGHSVRRLDPVWGSFDVAKQANGDTFHYTNAYPQHERLNQKEWLSLEDYLLKNINKSDQKLTVFTGPVFTDCDPVYRGIRIPQKFWKVAAMVHQGKLVATAYRLGQEQFMDDLEFVIGPYKSYQVPILEIEQLTGLSFGHLKDADPLSRMELTGAIEIYSECDIILA